jgi:hypothetical protein
MSPEKICELADCCYDPYSEWRIDLHKFALEVERLTLERWFEARTPEESDHHVNKDVL